MEVIIPLALNGTFVYEVPNNLISDLAVGIRVVVPFGAKRSYCAVVKEIHNNKPTGYEAKLINAIIDGKPILTLKHLQFWEWMGKYYMCSVGDVMNAALPAGLKIDHSDSILLNQSLEYNKNVLSDNEYLVVDALELQGSLKVEELELHSEMIGERVENLRAAVYGWCVGMFLFASDVLVLENFFSV